MKMENDICTYITKSCREWRLNNGFTLKDIAIDSGYSIQNICAFEHGRTNNMIILLTYASKGFNVTNTIYRYYRERI